MDVTAAFLNSDIEEDVYMKQPKAIEVAERRILFSSLGRVCMDQNNPPKAEMLFLMMMMMMMIGFSQSTDNPCIYVKVTDDYILTVALNVEDVILAGKTDEEIA